MIFSCKNSTLFLPLKKIILCKVKKGFYTIGALRTNRILYPKGIRSKASEIAQTLKPSDTSLVTVGGREFYIWRYEGKLNGITNAVVLLSYPKNAFGQKQALRMFISTNVDLSTQDILDIYVSRWPIEIFFRSSKSKLVLDTYQIRSQKWIERYWLIMSLMPYLCCICKGGYCSFEAFTELLHLPLRPLADRTEDVPIQPAIQM